MPRKTKIVSTTQKAFDEGVKGLAQNKETKVVKSRGRKKNLSPKGPSSRNFSAAELGSTLWQNQDYNTDHYEITALYKSYFKDKDRIDGYHAGSIIARNLIEFEKRAGLYLNTIKSDSRDKIKETLLRDIQVLIKKIEEL